MDKETARMLLESYRPQDHADPMFTDALAEAARDPELGVWFAEQQRFDALMGQKFREVPVPAEVKVRVLADARAALPVAPRARWPLALAAAAVLAAGLLAWRNFAPVSPGRALAHQAISFTQEMPALQFVCFDAGVVAQWVNEQPGVSNVALKLRKPAAELSMSMIGSSVVDWNGQPVVMVCLQNGKRMAMLYILGEKEAASLLEGKAETLEENGWAARTIKTGGQVRILAARGRAADLDFDVPF